MLSPDNRIAFSIFALLTLTLSLRGFYRVYLRVMRGREDTDLRHDNRGRRLWYAIRTTLLQERVFRKRPLLSVFHSFIFYAFVLYLLVNTVDAIEGFVELPHYMPRDLTVIYRGLADAFSVLAIIGVAALVARRFLLPSRRDFSFNPSTLLHESVRKGTIQRDSLIVSAFILFHVGSRIVGNAARLAIVGPERAQPFSSLLAHVFAGPHAVAWRAFGYWGALGSVLLFLLYFPYSKHIHLLIAPLKYYFHRAAPSGELPPVKIDLNADEPQLGAAQLADLSWPRLMDAYACIQCNRCQDVCPASQTGKALSPAALEINKRMVLNKIAGEVSSFSLNGKSAFESGAPTATSSGPALLEAIISPESVWACTTCGACMEICPTQNEQMLDIIDIRRNLVMLEGDFPAPLQSAFRGMERAANPWGISRDKRMDWVGSLHVPTIDEVPDPDVLYWVGCAASYDAGAQKTARAVVELLTEGNVKFAVLGKRESCTGDSARRAGNEFLYQELAQTAIATLKEAAPKLVIASCPHCVNTIATEYPQFGGNFNVMHHSEYLDLMVREGKLKPAPSAATVTFHDPCYLGRHRGTYDQPRSLLKILTNDYVELDRTKSNSFCCGAGGAQFWKEEEKGAERISDNRFREAQHTLDSAAKVNSAGSEKVLAVGCPFCKSMLQSSPSAGEDQSIIIKDLAELLLDGVRRRKGLSPAAPTLVAPFPTEPTTAHVLPAASPAAQTAAATTTADLSEAAQTTAANAQSTDPTPLSSEGNIRAPNPPERKKWTPKATPPPPAQPEQSAPPEPSQTPSPPIRKKWQPGNKN